MSKNICISGYYGFDNFGDETILKILVENLKAMPQVSNITVFSSNPQKTSKNFNVDSVNSFNIKEVVQSIIQSDCLISGGGSLLQDVTSAKSLIYYLGIIAIAQILRKKTIIFAQGIGPINNIFLKKLTTFFLKKANYICVRDEKSLNLLERWGIQAEKCDDPVWNINVHKTMNTNKVGIQLRDFSTLNDDFIKQLAICIEKYYKEKEICLLSLQNNLDLNVCKKLKTRLIEINKNLNIKIIENTSNEKLIEDICTMEEIIAMRFHACLIAIKAKIKLLPIIYDIKVETLAKEFQLQTLNLKNPEETSKIFNQFILQNNCYDENIINSRSFNFKKIEEIL